MNTARYFLLLACARYWKFLKRDTPIGAKEGKARENGMMSSLRSVLCDAYYQNKGHYGSPRIHADLKEQEIHCGRKRVARLMREKQLSARKKQRKVRTTESNHGFPAAPNLWEQDFT